MSQVSPSTDQVYGLQRVTRIWACRGRPSTAIATTWTMCGARDRDLLARCSDKELAAEIRQLLQDSPFHGEGYRKLWARLRFAGVRTSPAPRLRLMREHGLLAHQRTGAPAWLASRMTAGPPPSGST